MIGFNLLSLKYSSMEPLEGSVWVCQAAMQDALKSSQAFPFFSSFHQSLNIFPFIYYSSTFCYWTISDSMFFLCSTGLLLISEKVIVPFYLCYEGKLGIQTSWIEVPVPTFMLDVLEQVTQTLCDSVSS